MMPALFVGFSRCHELVQASFTSDQDSFTQGDIQMIIELNQDLHLRRGRVLFNYVDLNCVSQIGPE